MIFRNDCMPGLLAKVVLDNAEQNWLAALKRHTQVKKNRIGPPQYINTQEEEEEEGENSLLAALYPTPTEEPDDHLKKSDVHFFCCKRPGRPVECLPHADWHIRRYF